MATFEELNQLSSHELHDRAVHVAEKRHDVKFFFRLLETIPAAASASGDNDEASADIFSLRSLINDTIHAGDGRLADTLRPLFIEYLVEHSE